jgi:hypothetical protein
MRTHAARCSSAGGGPDRLQSLLRTAWRWLHCRGRPSARKFASCKIKTRKEDDQNVNIVAGSVTDIMLSNVQFTLKVVEPNKISRTFPGMPDMEISYYSCSI